MALFEPFVRSDSKRLLQKAKDTVQSSRLLHLFDAQHVQHLASFALAAQVDHHRHLRLIQPVQCLLGLDYALPVLVLFPVSSKGLYPDLSQVGTSSIPLASLRLVPQDLSDL